MTAQPAFQRGVGSRNVPEPGKQRLWLWLGLDGAGVPRDLLPPAAAWGQGSPHLPGVHPPCVTVSSCGPPGATTQQFAELQEGLNKSHSPTPPIYSACSSHGTRGAVVKAHVCSVIPTPRGCPVPEEGGEARVERGGASNNTRTEPAGVSLGQDAPSRDARRALPLGWARVCPGGKEPLLPPLCCPAGEAETGGRGGRGGAQPR